MDRWLQSVAGVVSTVVVSCAIGCSDSGEANSEKPSGGQVPHRVEENDQVTVLTQQGDRTLVRTDDGVTGFVPSDQLRVDSGGHATLTSDLDLQPAPELEPRPRIEVDRARRDVDVLYLSADGSQEFMRPNQSGNAFFDHDSGQVFWQAFTCTAAGCTGVEDARGRNVFPGVIRGINFKPDGSRDMTSVGDLGSLVCPVCGSGLRDGTMKRYRSPETAAEFDALTAEYRRRTAWERANR